MCGRYALYELTQFSERFHVNVPENVHPNYNAAPTQMMPVITDKGLDVMRWGLIPPWARDEKIGYKLINARAESVLDKPVWKKAVTQRRCLVPFNGFYEWQARPDGKHPFFIRPRRGGLSTFAGVWESWIHAGVVLHSYAILTTTPNAEMQAIHDRMPVILHPDDESLWLQADTPDDITALLAPYPDYQLEAFEVSRDVNVVRTNDQHLITPVNSA